MNLKQQKHIKGDPRITLTIKLGHPKWALKHGFLSDATHTHEGLLLVRDQKLSVETNYTFVAVKKTDSHPLGLSFFLQTALRSREK